jgi:hypothetical protein
MEQEYIKENDCFKCTIDDVKYDCYLDYTYSVLFYEAYLKVYVKKYIHKNFWFFKWKVLEFECTNIKTVTWRDYREIHDERFYKVEDIRLFVEGALRRREDKIKKDKSLKEDRNKIKTTKEI